MRLEPDYVAGQLDAGAVRLQQSAASFFFFFLGLAAALTAALSRPVQDNAWSAGRLRQLCPISAPARRRYCEMLLLPDETQSALPPHPHPTPGPGGGTPKSTFQHGCFACVLTLLSVRVAHKKTPAPSPPSSRPSSPH